MIESYYLKLTSITTVNTFWSITMSYTTIITPHQLTQLNPLNPIIIDTRHNLSLPDEGHQAYMQSHIVGAHFLHMDTDLSGTPTGTNGRHPLPDINILAKKLSEIGLNKYQQVIIYDQDSGIMAARLWWLLKYMGHDNVAVLDGGFAAYEKLKLPTHSDLPTLTTAGNFIPKIQTTMLVKIDWLEEHLDDNNIQIIDARSEIRFKGIEENIDPIAGHIPHAINRPATNNIDDNHNFKSTPNLQYEWNSLLQSCKEKIIIHSCGSGITACHNLLACEIAGIRDTKLYAGSWSEYCSIPIRKIEVSE